MSASPLISIVLPTHNGTRYLEAAVESCIGQTYLNWELILVDDASSDATPEIIARFNARDSRIRAIRHERNQRLPAALNSGFALARGEYLTWTSDDNLYRPRALQEMLSFLDANRDVGFVYADYTLIDEAGKASIRIKAGDAHELAVTNPVGACFLYRREVYERLGGYAEDMFLVEDYEYWIRVSCEFKIAPLHTDLYLYRTGGPLTQRRQAVRDAHERVLLRHLKRMSWARREARWRGYMLLVQYALMRNDRRAAARRACSALLCSPLPTAARIVRHFLPRVLRP